MAEGDQKDAVCSVWECQRCQGTNTGYRCTTCDAIKPYLPEQVLRPSTEQGEDLQDFSGEYTQLKSNKSEASASSEEQAQKVIDFPSAECRLVLLGKTGNGKSSTGNSILGNRYFEEGCGLVSTTSKSYWGQTELFGVTVEIVDTPGVFDTNVDDAVVTKEIVRCIGLVNPGPHALLLVIRVNAVFTKEEAKAVRFIRQLFGDGIIHHMIIVFTHGDSLEKNKPIEDLLRMCPRNLTDLLKDINYRYVVFNNTLLKESEANRKQVWHLMSQVRQMLIDTDNRHFTNDYILRTNEYMATFTGQVAQMLRKDPTNPRVHLMVEASLQANDNLQECLHGALDKQKEADGQIKQLTDLLADTVRVKEDLKAENELKKRWLEQVQKEKEIAQQEKEVLALLLQQSMEVKQKMEDDLKREITILKDNAAKKWKCSIL